MTTSIAAWLHDYWLNDSPAVHGLERIALYSTLLALCLLSHIPRPPMGDSPLQAPELFRSTHVPIFFERRGLATLLPQAWLTSPAAHPMLLALRNVTVAAWVCCILGLGGHGPVVLTALGVFLLEMFKVRQDQGTSLRATNANLYHVPLARPVGEMTEFTLIDKYDKSQPSHHYPT